MKRNQQDTSEDNREGIVFTAENGNEYTLTFSLGVLQKMELSGKFKLKDLQENMLNSPKTLFATAFEEYHPLVKVSERKAMYDTLERYMSTDDPDELTLIDVLGEMLNEAIESINPSGNVSWRRVKKGE